MNKRIRPRYHGVWCSHCRKKKPPVLIGAAFLVPVRTGYYDLNSDGSDIEQGLFGVCAKCLDDLNEFQRGRKQAVCTDNKHLVYRSSQLN